MLELRARKKLVALTERGEPLCGIGSSTKGSGYARTLHECLLAVGARCRLRSFVPGSACRGGACITRRPRPRRRLIPALAKAKNSDNKRGRRTITSTEDRPPPKRVDTKTWSSIHTPNRKGAGRQPPHLFKLKDWGRTPSRPGRCQTLFFSAGAFAATVVY